MRLWSTARTACVFLAAVLVLIACSRARALRAQNPSFLTSIATEADFIAVSVPSGGGDAERVTKYLTAASDVPDCAGVPLPLFQNVERFPTHQEFLRAIFPDCYDDLDVLRYLGLVERRATRRYFAGTLSRFQSEQGLIFGFTVFTDPDSQVELPDISEVRRIHADLSVASTLAGKLYYAPVRPEARAAAREWSDPGFPVYVETASDNSYTAYTRGTSYGTVRTMTLDEFEDANDGGRLSWQDILVLERAPSDIENVVAGIVTAEPQGLLSHVAVRAARRGTPNAYLDGALQAFAPLDGRLIRLEVRQTEYVAVEASLAEAEAFWEEHRPQLSAEPSFDPDYGEFDTLEEVELSGGGLPPEARYGGKATNMARLQRILGGELERFREPGFVIPVRYYLEFLRSNRMPSFDDPNRFVTYEDYLQELFSSDEFQSNPILRFDVLRGFREHLGEHGRVPLELTVELALRVQGVFGETSGRVRFRSSSNVEDILEFNGAGLYESTSACAADDLDLDENGPSLCDPARPNERGIARALKLVWASLWTSRAYEERAYFGIPQERAAMAILVTRAFVDERANGVAFTGNPANSLDRRYVVAAQVGEESVVSPRPGVLAERDLLHIDDKGEVVLIERRRPSSLLPEGEHVLSDDQLRDLGAVLWRIEQQLEVELEGHDRSDVLFDVEFKVEADGTLAVKQVRPFLITQPPPEGPVFELEVHDGTVLCGIFAEGRDAVAEYRVKSQLRLVPGRHLLPTVVDTFQGNLVDEIIFGSESERLEPLRPGFFHIRLAADGTGRVSYAFSYEQEFSLPGGGAFVFTLDFLDFDVRLGKEPETVHVIDGIFGSEELLLTGVPNGDRNNIVRYSSCAYEELPLWDVKAELADGTSVRLEERFRHQLAGTAPAALVGAEVELAGVRRDVRDYWRLVYTADHHNVNVRYLVILDPPVDVAEAGTVHAVELAEPRFLGDGPAEAIYRGDRLEALSHPDVLSFEKCADRCFTDFRRGDADSSGRVNLTDAIYLLDHLFRSGPDPNCMDAGDFDDDGESDITDAILVLFYLFRSVDSSAPPGPTECGPDPTRDLLEECRDASCG